MAQGQEGHPQGPRAQDVRASRKVLARFHGIMSELLTTARRQPPSPNSIAAHLLAITDPRTGALPGAPPHARLQIAGTVSSAPVPVACRCARQLGAESIACSRPACQYACPGSMHVACGMHHAARSLQRFQGRASCWSQRGQGAVPVTARLGQRAGARR